MTIRLPTFSASSPEDLIRFVKPGPRYTSYPPATEFAPTFTRDEAIAALQRLRASDDPTVSLYCHIPYCTSLCWYCGCNVVVSRDHGNGETYVGRLIREMDIMLELAGGRLPLAELSLGGGSPNFLPIDQLERLVAAVRDRFDVTDDVEFGIELDPRDTLPEQVAALGSCGFTRVSVGVQDFAEAVQKAIHRTQTVEQTGALIETARASGFTCVNADLVYGLPAQTPDSFAHTLDVVLSFVPDRIAMFGYAHLPHLRPHQKLVERGGAIPGVEARAGLLAVAFERYEKAGYVRVGLDHFARPDDSLVKAATTGRLHRNFQGYVVRRGSALLGVGASSISDTGTAYWQDHVDVKAWSEAVDAGALPVAKGVALDDDDRLRRWVITRLMCDNDLDMARVDAEFSIRFEDYFAAELATLSAGEYQQLCRIDREARRIETTPLGCDLIRNVCMVFDRYLARRQAMAGDRPRFSPTL